MPPRSQRKRTATQPFDGGKNPSKRARRAPAAAAKGTQSRRQVSKKDAPPPEDNAVSDPVSLDHDIEPPSAQPLPAIVLSSDLPSDPPSVGDPTQGETQEEETKSATGVSEAESPYVTCRWQAFVGPKKDLYKPKFDTEFIPEYYYAGQLWIWVDKVAQDLAMETTPPQKVTIRDVSGCAYRQKTPERQKLRQSLKRGDATSFIHVMEHAQHLRESSIDVTYLDFDATLATESVEVISPMGQQRSRGSSSSQGQVRLTATQRQLQELPEVLAGHAVAEGPSIAIRDKWRCQDTHCGNYPYVCWVQRTPGQPDRFENHFPVSSNIVAMWARNVSLERCSVDEPDDHIRLALRTARDLAAKEKAKEKAQQGSASTFTADSFMSAIAASALSVSQLAQSQLLARQAPPAVPTVSSASTPSVPAIAWKDLTWRDLTYENNMELLYQTRHFFDWWIDQAMAAEVPEIERVLRKVVKAGRIDLNMLMDGSDTGMPYEIWRDDFELPIALLLRLRKMAFRWQLQYPGLSESDREVCRELQRQDNEQKQQLRAAQAEGGETIV